MGIDDLRSYSKRTYRFILHNIKRPVKKSDNGLRKHHNSSGRNFNRNYPRL